MKTLKWWIVALVIAPFLTLLSVEDEAATPPPVTDYTLHTLYIFNFTKYVEWPSSSKAVKIGVVDNASAEMSLQKMAQAKSTSGSEITIINTRNETELASCQIIFVPSNNSQLAGKLIERFSEAAGNYNVLNLYASVDMFKVFNWSKKYSAALFTQADNILNSKVWIPSSGTTTPATYPLNPGRTIYVGIKAAL